MASWLIRDVSFPDTPNSILCYLCVVREWINNIVCVLYICLFLFVCLFVCLFVLIKYNKRVNANGNNLFDILIIYKIHNIRIKIKDNRYCSFQKPAIKWWTSIGGVPLRTLNDCSLTYAIFSVLYQYLKYGGHVH